MIRILSDGVMGVKVGEVHYDIFCVLIFFFDVFEKYDPLNSWLWGFFCGKLSTFTPQLSGMIVKVSRAKNNTKIHGKTKGTFQRN